MQDLIASGDIGGHAFLLVGPSGSGKTTIARLIAKALNGDECHDFVVTNAASERGINAIRDLCSRFAMAPFWGTNHKVYLLDEAHSLTPEAQEAMLGPLENLPKHVVVILATTEPSFKPTFLSRCQRFVLTPIPTSAIAKRLSHIARQEGYALQDADIREIASAARRNLRDALNVLEVWGLSGLEAGRAALKALQPVAQSQPTHRKAKMKATPLTPRERGRPSKEEARRQAFRKVLKDDEWHLWPQVWWEAKRVGARDLVALRALRNKLQRAGRIEVDRGRKGVRLRVIVRINR